ncbi:hypothetical protein JCM5353_005646 [Sporobolomyces roseus]
MEGSYGDVRSDSYSSLRPTPSSSAEIPTSLYVPLQYSLTIYADITSLDSVCNNLSVSILIDDKPVEMYKVQVKDNKATCYIESIEGKEFKIRSQMIQSFQPQGIAFFAAVDGTKIGGLLAQRIEDEVIQDGLCISASQKRPLMFSKINLTDNPSIASTDETYVKNLGIVRVTAFRGQSSGINSSVERYDPVSDNRSVDERSKKANVSHQVGFGAAKTVLQGPRVSMTFVDSVSAPYVTFEIKYLSRDLLELQDIIKPLNPLIEHNAPPSTSSSPKAKSSKKRKANFTIDNDGALIISDDSDEEGKPMTAKKEAGNKRLKGGEEIIKVKKEKGESSKVKVKKEKVVIELD